MSVIYRFKAYLVLNHLIYRTCLISNSVSSYALFYTMLSKQEIRIILIHEFKFGHNAAEATRNINSAWRG